MASAAPRNEFEQTSSQNASVVWAGVRAWGFCSTRVTSMPRSASCQATSHPARPAPMTVTEGMGAPLAWVPAMRLQLQDGSRIFIDLRATGLLRAVAHSPTLTARPARVTVDFADPPGESVVEATFRADAIEAPADIPASDREKMVENMRNREVLEASRFPTIDFRGRYAGTLDGGTLSGDLQVRSTVRARLDPRPACGARGISFWPAGRGKAA